MFCENCGKKRIADEVVCVECGNPFTKVEDIETQGTVINPVSESVTNPEPVLETQGNITINGNELQWVYEFSFWKNPTILITAAKVMLIGLLVPAIFMFGITIMDDIGEAFNIFFMILGYGFITMTVLLLLAYILLALHYGGNYYVLFKMDDEGVNHIQLDKQYKKAQALGFLTTLIGLSTGNLAASGAGLMAATKQSLYSSFKKVRSVKAVKSRNTIYVNESLTKNQIYASNEDFDFVFEHIVNRCPKNVRVIEK